MCKDGTVAKRGLSKQALLFALINIHSTDNVKHKGRLPEKPCRKKGKHS